MRISIQNKGTACTSYIYYGREENDAHASCLVGWPLHKARQEKWFNDVIRIIESPHIYNVYDNSLSFDKIQSKLSAVQISDQKCNA